MPWLFVMTRLNGFSFLILLSTSFGCLRCTELWIAFDVVDDFLTIVSNLFVFSVCGLVRSQFDVLVYLVLDLIVAFYFVFAAGPA